MYFKTTSRSGKAEAGAKVSPHPGPVHNTGRSDAKKEENIFKQAGSKFLMLIVYRFIR